MTLKTTSSTLIVVRHAPVDQKYHGVCYGRSDAELGPEGKQLSYAVAEELAARGKATIVHSGLQRTRFLAERLAEQLDCSVTTCEALRERDFGDWEMQPWSEIHAQYGDEILRMISEPESYRPGGGETTFEMRDRVMQWFASLPNAGRTIAVTHGGPIASLLGSQRRMPVTDWLELIPRCGQIVPIDRGAASVCHWRASSLASALGHDAGVPQPPPDVAPDSDNDISVASPKTTMSEFHPSISMQSPCPLEEVI